MMGKLVEEYRAGRVTAAIVLVNNCTETQWFQEAAVACQAICFPCGRIRFLDSEGQEAGQMQGQAFLYFGRDVDGSVQRCRNRFHRLIAQGKCNCPCIEPRQSEIIYPPRVQYKQPSHLENCY
jgi:hypothetical protein